MELLKRFFYPEDFDANDAELLVSEYKKILSLELNSATEFYSFILRANELYSIYSDQLNELYMQMLINEDKIEYTDRYNQYAEVLFEKAIDYMNQVERKFIDSPFLKYISDDSIKNIVIEIKNDLAMQNEENIGLFLDEMKLKGVYSNLISNLKIEIEDEEIGLFEARSKEHNHIRETREKAWITSRKAVLAHKDQILEIFADVRKIRQSIAKNVGLDNFYTYLITAFNRRFFSENDVQEFIGSVEKVLSPFYAEYNQSKKKKNQLNELRPWDILFSQLDHPLIPYKDTQEFLSKVTRILYSIKFDYGIMFNKMVNSGFLDLESRSGKIQQDCYSWLFKYSASNIIINTVKSLTDIKSLFHLCGHTFQWHACCKSLYLHAPRIPAEIKELASKGMEVLSVEYWDEFFPLESDFREARRYYFDDCFKEIIDTCITHEFHKFICSSKVTDPETLANEYQKIYIKFYPGIDIKGFEELIKWEWLSNQHLISFPSSGIETAFATLGSLDLYLNYQKNKDKTLIQYQEFLNSGAYFNSEKLYKMVGARFDFSKANLKRLIDTFRKNTQI